MKLGRFWGSHRLKLTEDIQSGFDKRLITIVLLFDFSKAFDQISHTTLLRKLSNMRLSRSRKYLVGYTTISPSKLLHKLIRIWFSKGVVLWIKSYLKGRNQKVDTKLNGNSNWLTTNLGVPQGSVLRPLLFSLYINDLQCVLSHLNNSTNDPSINSVKHLLYADDLQIYTQITRFIWIVKMNLIQVSLIHFTINLNRRSWIMIHGWVRFTGIMTLIINQKIWIVIVFAIQTNRPFWITIQNFRFN